ncbi:MAG TPA: FAD-dependent tricarballylate dehydrogenase TcuA, partial [Caulobacteraceae bacterium]|nr:FAD-dependent tricarballylate dehydrogenase TcuA [Caulobacteraceae bacterium]
MALPDSVDVVVVGAGNAALGAALAAAERGCSVLVLERAPEAEAGGNSRFTAGAFRCVYDGVDDLRALMPDLTDAEVAQADFGTYTAQQFFDDMGRVTEYRTDPELCDLLVNNSRATMLWLREQGVRFLPIWGRQAYRIDGRFKFWGGLTVEAVGGGPGLIEALYGAARKTGVQIAFGAHVTELVVDDAGVSGVRVRADGRTSTVSAKAIVLACGGFESNAEWRTRYLGPGWDLAKVRGTRFNTGDGIRMALDAGAEAAGNWSGCHAVAWDRNAPDYGDLAVGDGFQKHSYPLGVMLNARGQRFIDEGADFRNYTYAKYGRVILEQPQQFAWQLFDATVSPLLRDEYRIRQASRVRADTLEELVGKLEGVEATAALATLKAFNAAVTREVPFDPNVKDGRTTRDLAVPKSNWANPIETPPFEAYQVTCGVTFTFGGLKVDRSARVISADAGAIPGLFASGELV